MSKISVIIPCYNHAGYLGETIESVLAQTHPAEEIIVVDDGSKDTSAEVAGRYAQAHPRVRLLRQENAGRSAAANHGLRESTGEYLVFLDADDRLLPHALAAGLEQLDASPGAGLAAGQCIHIDSNGVPMVTERQPVITEAYYERLLTANFIWNPGNVLFRRSAVEAAGGFNTEIKHAEDYDIYLKIAREASFACYPEIVAEYRQHPNNKSKSGHTMLPTILQVLEGEAAFASRSPKTRQAWREGLRYTKEAYGDVCVTQFHQHLRSSKDWGRAWAELRTFVRYHPRGYLRFLRNLWRSKMSGSAPSHKPR